MKADRDNTNSRLFDGKRFFHKRVAKCEKIRATNTTSGREKGKTASSIKKSRHLTSLAEHCRIGKRTNVRISSLQFKGLLSEVIKCAQTT